MSEAEDSDAGSISPHFTRDKVRNKPSIDDKIDVYEDRLQGWVFDHAMWLLSSSYPLSEHAHMAVLLLTNAYFEQTWCYRVGRESDGNEFTFFKEGFNDVFGITPEHSGKMSGVFWSEVRSKLSHEGLPGSRVIVDTTLKGPLAYTFNDRLKIGSIVINPRLFLETLHAHFRSFVSQLRDQSQVELRKRFETFFDLLLTERPGPVPFDQVPLA